MAQRMRLQCLFYKRLAKNAKTVYVPLKSAAGLPLSSTSPYSFQPTNVTNEYKNAFQINKLILKQNYYKIQLQNQKKQLNEEHKENARYRNEHEYLRRLNWQFFFKTMTYIIFLMAVKREKRILARKKRKTKRTAISAIKPYNSSYFKKTTKPKPECIRATFVLRT